MRFHWQNLNERKNRPDGSIVRNGRAWWGPFQWEWVAFRRAGFGAQIGLADYDHALSGHIKLFFFALYLSYNNHRLENWIEQKVKRPDEKYGNGRTIGFSVHSGALWIDLWNDPTESRRSDPRWWHACFDPADFFLGHAKYSSKTIRTERAIVPMPEGGYPCTVTINEDSWKRPRWFRQVLIRSEVKPDTPIAHPGKGENSWDCGEDALFSQYGKYESTLDAVMAAAQSVMNDRLRHGGGWDYRPQKEWAKQ